MSLCPVTQNVGAERRLAKEQKANNNRSEAPAVTDFPRSLIEFQPRFPDEAACVKYLFAARWPAGFVCPGCGTSKAWPLQTKPWIWECAGCGRQTSVTAGTIMRHPTLPPTLWFWAAHLRRPIPMASRPCNCDASSAWTPTATLGCSAASCAAACGFRRNRLGNR
jgi:hypothetical protein